jgi:hypothetical protein
VPNKLSQETELKQTISFIIITYLMQLMQNVQKDFEKPFA